MKKSIFFIVGCFFCVGVYGQVAPSATQNYVHKTVYKKAVQESGLGSVSGNDKIESISYFDGLGRPLQSIGVRQGGKDASNTDTDLITPAFYDAYGRAAKAYLPYTSSANDGRYDANALMNVNSYYTTNFGSEVNLTTPNPYSEKLFEASPLNRVLKQSAPGEAWKLGSTREIEFDYQTNATGEVRMYTVSLITDYIPILQNPSPYYYAPGELYKTITRDENHSGTTKNNTTEEFKDKQGRVVLKRTYNADIPHDTYYVYDDYGNLTYVLPPKSEPQSAQPSSTELSELCYQYKYDKRNRLVEKKVPGKNVEFIVYNDLDQPVLTQDANLKAQNKWLYTKYDAFGRVVSTGLFTNTSITTRETMQTALDNHYSGTAKSWEEKTTTSSNNYYTNQSYPTTGIEVLTLNYYDNYTFDTAGLKLNAGTLVFNDTVEYTTKGLPTGSRVKVLGQTTWITSLMHYDDKGRVIYSASNNGFLGSTDKVKQDLDFMGNVLSTETTHTKGSMNIVTLDSYTYDHVNRLLKHTQTLNGRTELITENSYSETGELKIKKLGNIATSSTRLQTVDYTYNVRGWLKQINNPTSLGTDLFGFKLNYNTANHLGTPLFNGNIAETEWKTQNDNVLRWYRYGYDNLNRITAAYDSADKYNLTNLSYDKNGNIMSLTRKGPLNGSYTTFGTMDALVYEYNNDSNKLKSVNDSGSIYYGFKDNSTITTQYRYDLNGNMVMDDNKKIGTPTIDGITYNHLNLPTSVSLPGGTISYIYDATGVKQRKVAAGTTTEYAGNYLYQGGTLQFFNHPEGYVEYDGGSYNYIYNYKDHLGNIRLSYTDINQNNTNPISLKIAEENNYYPFGLRHKGYNDTGNGYGNSAAKKYKFGGKELQEEHSLEWYDITARNYDPALGRWMNLDPLAEQMRRHSPYNYGFDNPIFFQDPDGMMPCPTGDCPDPPNGTGGDISRANENQPYVSGSIGFGFTFGFELEVGPASIGASKDFGTTANTFGTEGTGAGETVYTEGFSIETPIIGYSERTSTDISQVTQFENEDGTATTPIQNFETTRTTTQEVSSMGGAGVWESKQNGIYSINNIVQSQKGVKAGTNTISKLTTKGSGDFTPNRSSAIKSNRSDIKFGVKLNAGMRIEIEVGIRDIPSAKSGFRGTTCFVRGTKILMKDGSQKSIEEIVKGDEILSVNINTMTIEPDIVVDVPEKTNLYRKITASFTNGIVNNFSPAHPYWVLGKGWCVYDVDEAKRELNFSVEQLKIGDKVLFYEKGILIETEIEKLYDTQEIVKMYNVEYVRKNHTFFANGILVHNKLN